jgi:hypothetical protein
MERLSSAQVTIGSCLKTPWRQRRSRKPGPRPLSHLCQAIFQLVPPPTKGGKGRIVADAAGGGVEIGGVVPPIYLSQQAAFQADPPIPMQTAPGPGIGRLGFVGYWTGVSATIAKRVNRRFSGGVRVTKQFSQMDAPSIYSVDVNGVGANANGNANNARGWGWKPQQQQDSTQEYQQQSN